MLGALATSLMLATAAPAGLAPTLTPSGWSLELAAEMRHPYLLVGEDLGRERVRVTLANTSTSARAVASLSGARRAGLLEVAARTAGKTVPRIAPYPPFGVVPKWDFQVVKSGERLNDSFPLLAFGYKRLRNPGTVVVRAALETEQGAVVSRALRVAVVDIPDRDVLATKVVPPDAKADRPNGTAPLVVIQLAEVGPDRWLLYRRYVGPAHGGHLEVTERLANVKGLTDFTVAGSFGDEPLTVTYSDKPGKTIKIVLDSYLGTTISIKSDPSDRK